MRMAAEFFIAQLHTAHGRKALDYLQGRALLQETVKRFGLGYAPDSKTALREHLRARGVEIRQMVDAGLLIHGEGIPEPYDRVRDRVMFPIQDGRGRVIAFGGRALSRDVAAKYLNSPETTLFHKGQVLYNAHRARAAAHEADSVLVMEGYMDVIAAAQAGFAHAVAPLGTALTTDQLKLLWRYAHHPILCFDGDKAGLKAAYRAVEVALPELEPGKSLRFALLPEGQDPDDLLRSRGRGALDEVLAQARPLFAMLWSRETQGQNLDEPEARAALEQRLKGLAATIREPSVRRWYEDAVREELRRFFRPTYGERQGRSAYAGKGATRGTGARGSRPGQAVVRSESLMRSALVQTRSNLSPRECVIVMTAISHPELLETHAEDFAAIRLSGRELELLRQAAFDELAVLNDASLSLRERLAARGLSSVMGQVMAVAEKHRANWFMQPDSAFADVEAAWGHMVALHRKRHELSQDLEEATRMVGERGLDADFERQKQIKLALDSVEGQEAELENFGAASGRRKGAM